MKNVLIVANNGMGNSGVPNVICQVTNSISEKCKVYLIVFNNDNFYYPFLLSKNVQIIKLNIETPQSSLKKIYWYFRKYPNILKKEAFKIIKNNEIDIVHSFKEEEGWPILKAAKKLNVKLRITHCNNEFRKRNGFVQQIIAKRNQRKLLKYSNCNIGVCNKCCESMYKKKPYVVLYNTYNETKFNPNVHCNLNNELVLTQIATYSSRKNQFFSIDVLETIVRRGLKCKLNLVGFPIDESYFNKMRQIIIDRKLSDYISIIDGKNGINEILCNTTFLLLPSVSEAAPITLVEAQASGILCFASNTITEEMNCGGIIYLPIDKGSEIWANAIEKTFMQQGNKRNNYNTDKFSTKNFDSLIKKIYKL